MGIRDEIRKSVSTAIEGGVRGATSWVENRANARRMDQFDSAMDKAVKDAVQTGQDGTHDMPLSTISAPSRDPKALHYNPFDLVAAMGFRERPSALTYQALELVGRTVPVIADIIGARTQQVLMFCDLPEDRFSSGFKVRHRDWRTQAVTPAIEKEQEQLEQMLLYTGYHDPEQPQQTVSLAEFARQFIPDSLIFDQACFEVVPDRRGDPSYFTIVDPSTVRLLDQSHRDPGDPYAVQVIAGSIVSDFTRDELAFCIRNPRSGIRSYGYGLSEVETLTREITGLLWGMQYNRSFFTNGSATKGVLNFKGTIPDRHLQAFRRQWYSMVSGVSNAWKTPITNAEELQWINMQMSNRDMEYSAWIDFLIKICCARFMIAPEEVQFQYGNTGQSQSMGTSPVEDKIKASKDLGLRPIVRWFFTQLNQWFLQRVNPDFEAVAVGLDEKGPEAETDLISKQVTVFLTVDEARERVELAPLGKEKGGDMILNPVYLQYVMSQQQAPPDAPPDPDDHFEVDDTNNDPFDVSGGEGGNGGDQGSDEGGGEEPPPDDDEPKPEPPKDKKQPPPPPGKRGSPIAKAEVQDLFDVVDSVSYVQNL